MKPPQKTMMQVCFAGRSNPPLTLTVVHCRVWKKKRGKLRLACTSALADPLRKSTNWNKVTQQRIMKHGKNARNNTEAFSTKYTMQQQQQQQKLREKKKKKKLTACLLFLSFMQKTAEMD